MSLKITGLTKRFGRVTAVDTVDLTLADGELLAVVGPSGCGKTTLLRMIAGLERPDSGRITLQDRDITSVPPERRDVSIVFQNFALFPHMNVAENIAYGLKWNKTAHGEREKRVHELLETMDLTDLGHRRPNELSAGQQQRVALARALAPRPKTLLLDEPLSALDASLRERLRLEIRRIQREYGITTLLVTHDQDEALGTADRVAVMNAGRFEQIGDPWELYDQPQTPFVARFIGQGNMMDVTVSDDYADLGSWGRVNRSQLPPGLAKGKALLLIRPESVVLDSSHGEPSHDELQPKRTPGLTLNAVLHDVTFKGNNCALHLESGEKKILAAASGHDFSRWRKRIGESVSLLIPFESMRWV